MGTLYGTATVSGNSAYVSRHFTIYEYRITEDSWSKLCTSQYQSFSLAVIQDHLTTIGGIGREQNRTQSLLSFSATSEAKEEWEELYPPIPTHRVCAAVLTTPTHLVVVGGRNRAELRTIEVLDVETSQWSSALSLPEPMGDPLMTLCEGNLYVCKQQQATCHSFPLDTLLQSCRTTSEAPPTGDAGLEWTRLANTPTSSGHSLATLGGQVLLFGGQDEKEAESVVVHGYDHTSAAWVAVGEIPTPRTDMLAVVPTTSQELVVIGGWSTSSHMTTEIASIINQPSAN